jgi:hypothetical protein
MDEIEMKGSCISTILQYSMRRPKFGSETEQEAP